MKWLRWPLLGLGLVIATGLVLTGIGAMLPPEHTESIEVTVPRRPEEVWALIRNHDDGPRWRTGLEKVDHLEPRDGKPVVVEHLDQGPLTILVETSEPPHRMVTRIVDEEMWGGTWTFEITPEGEAGARLTITENGVVHNALARFFACYVLGYRTNLEAYAAAVEAELG